MANRRVKRRRRSSRTRRPGSRASTTSRLAGRWCRPTYGSRIRRWYRRSMFGLIGSESANSMFSAANFPGASATDLQNATSLYAMLTGRIASIQGDARINPAGDAYVPLGLSRAEGRMREFDFFAADSWRVTPSVTVSAGVALRPGQPVLPGQQQLHDGDGRQSVRHLGRWQLVQAGDADRHQACLRSVSRRHLRVQPGQEQSRAERRIRLAAAGARQGLRAAAARVGGRRQRDSRRRGDGVSSVPACRTSRARSARTRGSAST